MTLTDRLTSLEAERVLTCWNQIVARLGPLPIAEFCWSIQSQSGGPFAIRERFTFGKR
jgi:hypothetical protein